MYKKGKESNKNQPVKKSTNKNKKTETLSSLLKNFNQTLPKIEEVSTLASHFITQARLKRDWPSVKIAFNTGDHKNAEDIALSSADFLEKNLKELKDCIEEIDEKKAQAIEFARNCFIYLNNVHRGTCLGEAGKIMLDLFDQGELSGNVILGLIDKAEKISKNKDLPFANKLTSPQTKAITFMVEERDIRIAPTIENLQNYTLLCNNIFQYTPLLKALTHEDFKIAQKLVNKLLSNQHNPSRQA
jgi:hypothetical protein